MPHITAAASIDLLRGQSTTSFLFKGDLESLLIFSNCLISVRIFTDLQQSSQAHCAYFPLRVCQQVMAMHLFSHTGSENFVLYGKWHCWGHVGWQVTGWTAPTLWLLCIHHGLHQRTIQQNRKIKKKKKVAAILGIAAGKYWAHDQKGLKFKCCSASLLDREASFTIFKTKWAGNLAKTTTQGYRPKLYF